MQNRPIPINTKPIITKHAAYRYYQRLAPRKEVSTETIYNGLEHRIEEARVISEREIKFDILTERGRDRGSRFEQYREDLLGVYILEIAPDGRLISVTALTHELAYGSNIIFVGNVMYIKPQGIIKMGELCPSLGQLAMSLN